MPEVLAVVVTLAMDANCPQAPEETAVLFPADCSMSICSCGRSLGASAPRSCGIPNPETCTKYAAPAARGRYPENFSTGRVLQNGHNSRGTEKSIRPSQIAQRV